VKSDPPPASKTGVMGKTGSVACIVVAVIAGMSLWFVSAAIMPGLIRESPISVAQQAMLASSVQGGFVLGALVFAISGLPDRFDPRKVLLVCALGAAGLNLVLLAAPAGSSLVIGSRAGIGFLLAGVYPVGMKLAVGWGIRDRGFLVGLLVGAVTIGSASPHLLAWAGPSDWRPVVVMASIVSAAGALPVLLARLGPHHAQAPRFNMHAVSTLWSDRRIRLAYSGYLGHMWELYVMWAWIATAVAASYALLVDQDSAVSLSRLTAFIAIAAGGISSIAAGLYADKFGKARTTIIAMGLSGTAAIATALSLGGPIWLTFIVVVVWGATVIPDSAQFSALVADFAPPDQAGSLMTLQTALGFALTFLTVQAAPMIADAYGWPVVLAATALGPMAGVAAMARLRRLTPES
jgi:MFS family permease